jgi:hypothetical protein
MSRENKFTRFRKNKLCNGVTMDFYGTQTSQYQYTQDELSLTGLSLSSQQEDLRFHDPEEEDQETNLGDSNQDVKLTELPEHACR